MATPNPTSIVDDLLQSYQNLGGINRLDRSNLPTRRRINEACDKLLQLLFPGYYDDEPVPADELQMITSERIHQLLAMLASEMSK
ncbi:MAG: serine acetyltransferase, partial [Verrucomicrobiota bacterium]